MGRLSEGLSAGHLVEAARELTTLLGVEPSEREARGDVLRWVAHHGHSWPQNHPPGPAPGFAAEASAASSAASILYVAGLTFGAPISTTHTITSTIMGVGATKRLSAVRWGVAKNIVSGWVLTFPGAGLIAATSYAVTIPFQ